MSEPSSSSGEQQRMYHQPARATWTHVQRLDGSGGSRDSHPPRSPVALATARLPARESAPSPAAVESPMLIQSSPRRTPRLSTLQPPPSSSSLSPHSDAISAPLNHSNQQDNRNVPPLLVNGQPIPSPSDSTRRYGTPSQSYLESLALSSYQSSPQHGLTNSSSSRPRTFNPVFHNPSDLAAHHGIPQHLPPLPSLSNRRPTENTNLSSPDYQSLLSNYLFMLRTSQNVESTPSTAAQNILPPTAMVDDEAAAKAVLDAIGGAFDMAEFLTSPFESQMDDMLTTPFGSDLGTSPDIFASPMLEGFGDSFDDSMPLFGPMPGYDPYESKPARRPIPSYDPGLNNLIPMSPGTPATPALDPSSFHASPIPGSASSATRRRNAPTGTRKNLTPESLVPLNAPIQPRKYVTPSQTSKKELPATFARKRARSQAFGEDDELAAEDGSLPTLTEEEAIKAKRLQNTLAARRSRKRKLEYQRELEEALEAERKEKEMWKSRALVLEALLRDKGFNVPPIENM